MSVRLPDEDVAFYLAAATQLPPRERPEFQECVAAILRTHPDPGPGTCCGGVLKAIPGNKGANIVPWSRYWPELIAFRQRMQPLIAM
jgi:hypothetical protein